MFYSGYDRRFMSLGERFNDMYVVSPNSCWIWTGSTDRGGYGRMTRKNASTYAHRISYEIHVGPIPGGLVVDHLCRIRNCVNWRHLEVVTKEENDARSIGNIANLNRSKTACVHGHTFTPQNTIARASGRLCRTCRNAIVCRYKLKCGKVSRPYGPRLKKLPMEGDSD